MANFFADIPTVQNGPAYGQPLNNKISARKIQGRIRYVEAMFIAPASGTAPAIADKIYFVKIPVRARILGYLGKLQFAAGTASCTLNLGDNVVAARHLAATAINAAGSATPNVADFVQSSTATTVIGSNQLTVVTSLGAYTIGAIVTGTGIPSGTTVVGIDLASKIVTLSAPATAAGTAVAITVTGCAYETTDDSNTVANAYSSTTDDCTLVGTVAGAQVANNQAINLKMAFVQD